MIATIALVILIDLLCFYHALQFIREFSYILYTLLYSIFKMTSATDGKYFNDCMSFTDKKTQPRGYEVI